MITTIDFLSLARMRRVRHHRDIVVISILDASEAHERPRLNGFGGALALEFEDTDLSQHELWADAGPSLIRGPELRDAIAIDEFVWKYHRDPDVKHLIVHCHAGISRSAAVALWYSNVLRVPLDDDGMRTTDGANLLMLKLLEQVARERGNPTTVESLSPVIY